MLEALSTDLETGRKLGRKERLGGPRGSGLCHQWPGFQQEISVVHIEPSGSAP